MLTDLSLQLKVIRHTSHLFAIKQTASHVSKLGGLRANETRSNWTRSIFSVPMRRVSVGRVPMRRVPNRRGYIVMADTFTWFIKYCCIIDVFMRNER